ncbi:dynactin subunit 3-like isoform X2 [Liolophura sinensis]|uniref:dynactin subunit 3-like isoform X2 n=1 Tax=Liolophura sinensis TaxID=3198878 RepID=UPI0031584182
MAERQLDVLEERIEQLENLVFGSANKDSMYPKCIDSLAAVQSKIHSSVTGKKRVAKAYDKIPYLEKYLDSSYTDQLTLPEASKIEIILAEENFIRDQAKKLEEIENLSKFISSEHLKSVPAQTEKLQQLFQIQIKQQDQTALISEETEKLLSDYNKIITLIWKQFLQWNETLCKVEMSQSKK